MKYYTTFGVDFQLNFIFSTKDPVTNCLTAEEKIEFANLLVNITKKTDTYFGYFERKIEFTPINRRKAKNDVANMSEK